MKATFKQMVTDIAANPRVLLAEVAAVVILSGIFEKIENWLRTKFAKSGQETGSEIMNALFKEITTLGFVAFVIFLVTHTGAADMVAPKMFRDNSIYVGGYNPLTVTFETVHIMIFLLLIVLLLQASAMYVVSEQVSKRWGGFERTVSYGNARATLESKFVEAGYLERVPDPDSDKGMTLKQVKPFEYGSNWVDRLLNRDRPLHKLLRWRAIRHEFLFPNTKQVVGGKTVSKVPDPSLFSFEQYLHDRLGKVVLNLIHVDRWTWVVALGLMAAPLYFIKHFPGTVSVELIHCVMAWSIAVISLGLCVSLDNDLMKFTPKLPEKVTDILKLFAGESYQQLRRSKIPGWVDRPVQVDQEFTKTTLDLPEAMTTSNGSSLSSKGYSLLFKMLSFFQAVSFTSLFLSHLSEPFQTRVAWVWYAAALLEWPFFLFIVVPVVIRRLTIRSSIGFEKDDRLIRKVTTQTKESLLRDYARLVQIIGFEKRASASKQDWTLSDSTWDSKQAIQIVLSGLKKFDKMPSPEKREIWAMFAAWDSNSSGSADTKEFVEAFKSMGSKNAENVVDNLVRLVDFDGTKTINWMKFKAIYGLATSEESQQDMRSDFRDSFSFLDTNSDGEVSIFELGEGFSKMNVGIGLDDVANLLFLYFGTAKPTITVDEFTEWVVADRCMTLSAVQYKA